MTLQKFQKQYFLEDYAENIEVSKMHENNKKKSQTKNSKTKLT